MSVVIVCRIYLYWGESEYFFEFKYVFGFRSRIFLNENYCNGWFYVISVICFGR